MVPKDGMMKLDLEPEPEDEVDRTRWMAPFLALSKLAPIRLGCIVSSFERQRDPRPCATPNAPPCKQALELGNAAEGAYGKTKHANK